MKNEILQNMRSDQDLDFDVFTDELYGLVWKYKFVDVLEEALHSKNEEVLGSAHYVLVECASVPELKKITPTILALASGNRSKQKTFLCFLRDSGFYTKETSDIINDFLNSVDLLLRRLAIVYVSALPSDQINKIGRLVFTNESYSLNKHSEFDDWAKTDNRKVRAFRVAIMLALGFSNEQIDRNIELEDSFSITTTYRLRRPLISDAEKLSLLEKIPFK